MSAPSKACNIQSVQIQLAGTSEQHPARRAVTFCCEAMGRGWQECDVTAGPHLPRRSEGKILKAHIL